MSRSRGGKKVNQKLLFLKKEETILEGWLNPVKYDLEESGEICLIVDVPGLLCNPV